MNRLLRWLLAIYWIFTARAFATIPNKKLEQMIGQMIITDIYHSDIDVQSCEEYKFLVSGCRVGGIILYNKGGKSNQISSPEQVKRLINKLQSYASIPLFIAVDVEGGLVDRLKFLRGKPYLSAKEIGEKVEKGEWSLDDVYRYAVKQAKFLRSLGFNLNFAPVLDLAVDMGFMESQQRCFSSDPSIVAEIALQFLKAYKEQGVLACVKHFPGIGQLSEAYDPHNCVPLIKNYDKDRNLFPFIAVRDLVDAIMCANVIVPYFGKLAVPLNENVVNFIRQQFGCNELIITDELYTSGLGYYSSKGNKKERLERVVEAAYLAILAGYDIVLVRTFNKPYIIKKIIQKVEKAVHEGIISDSVIIESYNRIIRIKRQYCIINK